MDPRDHDEVRRLQALVYGRAGGATDEDAVRRLAQLTEATPGATLDDDAGSDPTPGSTDAAQDAEPAPLSSEESDARADHLIPPARRRRRWLVPALWAGSLVVAVLVAVGVGRSSVQPWTLGAFPADSEPIGVLSPEPTFRVPGFFIFGTDSDVTAFEEFNGLRPIVTTGGAYRGAGNEDEACLTVVLNGDLDSATSSAYSGILFEGCAANGFVASTQFVVSDELPSAVTDVFPEGTALQFVYDEGTNRVLVSRSDD